MNNSGNVFLKLYFSEDNIEKYNGFKTTVFKTAHITKVDSTKLISEINSLVENYFMKAGKGFLLTGNCLAIAEITPLEFQK